MLQGVRLHIAGNGTIWILSQCKICGQADKHLAADAIVAAVACTHCGLRMDMKDATIEAVALANEMKQSLKSAAADCRPGTEAS
jgi:hypothetical protein